MRTRLSRRGAVLGGVAVTAVLGVTSMVAACVPQVDLNKFKVKDASGASAVTSAAVGAQLTAAGTSIDLPNWPYEVKLHPGNFNDAPATRGNCGTYGTLQTVARSTPASQRFASSFNAPFVLVGAPGPAHFCAIAGAEKTTSGLAGALEYYIYDGFVVL